MRRLADENTLDGLGILFSLCPLLATLDGTISLVVESNADQNVNVICLIPYVRNLVLFCNHLRRRTIAELCGVKTCLLLFVTPLSRLS